MKEKNLSIRRITNADTGFVFEITNDKGLKELWVHYKDYGVKYFIIGMETTFDYMESYVFENSDDIEEIYNDFLKQHDLK